MKNIVVTGSSSGIGLAIAQELCKDNIVVGVSRKQTPIKNKNFVQCFLDISNIHFIPLWSKNTFAELEGRGIYPIHAIINNAAIFERSPFHLQSDANIASIMDTNVTGLMVLTKAFMSEMQRNSHIINISSVAGIRGIANQAVYSASKHAINGFSDSLNEEGDFRVTSICCGGVDTPLWNESNPYIGDKSKLLSAKTIANFVRYILEAPDNTVFKTVVLSHTNTK